MQILVLQLARFGDIYQSWPTLNALKRKWPEAKIHILVRERFAEALIGMDGIIVHHLPTREILKPIVLGLENDLERSVTSLLESLRPLSEIKFDRIINLSYSPLSSYLSDMLSVEDTVVRGYSRYSDGHLRIPDDGSAYFYAQVGIGRANRHHLCDIFALTADVELSRDDFVYRPARDPQARRQGIVVHLGASTRDKVYPPELWVETLKELSAGTSESITLIGSRDERALSEAVCGTSAHKNLVGETTLAQTLELIAGSRLLIGADSAPIHMASLTQTLTLNLSSAVVNFWETGPLTAQSRVLYDLDLAQLHPATIADEANRLLNGLPPGSPCAIARGPGLSYALHDLNFEEFPSRLIDALYTDANYPAIERREDELAFHRLYELADLAMLQFERWPGGNSAEILRQVDDLFVEVIRLNPRVEPMVQWFQTERVRIPPGEAKETLERTRKVFSDLRLVASVYKTSRDEISLLNSTLELAHRIIPALRECTVGEDFQELLSLIQELAARSTKVAELSWTELLTDVERALTARDYLNLADILEWRLVPNLSKKQTETLAVDVIS